MAENKKSYVIVVGFDLSEQANHALEQAIALAQSHDSCDLHVLGVLDNRASFGSLTGTNKVDYGAAEKAQEAIRKVAEERLSELESRPLQLFVHARIGSPAKELVSLANEANANMLVVGTHGRSGVGRWFLGSVAEKVVRTAPCPVLVARPEVEAVESDAADELQPEPPCPDCVAKREETDGQVWWCEVHGKVHLEPHTYHYDSGIAPKRPSYAPIL